MEGSGVTADQRQNETEPSRDVENVESQNACDEKAISQSSDDGAQIDERSNGAADISKKFIVNSCASYSNPSKICRPLSVKIIRLPDAFVNTITAVSDIKPRRRKQYRWKSGFVEGSKRKRYMRQRRLRCLEKKAEALKSFRFSENDVAIDGESSKPDEQSVSTARTTSVGNNEDCRETEQFTEKCETAVVEERISIESSVIESTDLTATHETNQRQSDSEEVPEISEESENHSATRIVQVSTVSGSDNPESPPKTSPLVCTEQNNNLNCESVSQRPSENDSSIIGTPEIRKRVHQSGDAEIESPKSPVSKKPKYSEVAEPSETTKTRESPENIVSITENVETTETVVTASKPKFPRRRTKLTADNIYKESRVVLCKIEDSRDPFVLRWRMKMTLQRFNKVPETDCETRSTTNLSGSEEDSESGETIIGVPIASLEDGPELFDVVEGLDELRENACDSTSEDVDVVGSVDDESGTPMTSESARNDNEMDEDDDEIVNFLRDRRKARPTISSSSSSSPSDYQDALSTRTSPNGTPTIDSPCLEKISDPPEAETSRPRNFGRAASTDTPISRDSCSDDGISPTSRRRRAAIRKRTVFRRRIISESSSSACSDATPNPEEIRRSPPVRRKAFQIAMDAACIERFDTSGDSSTESADETSNSLNVNECHPRKETSNVEKIEAGRTEERVDDSELRNSDIVGRGSNRDDGDTLDYLDGANPELSRNDVENSTNRDEDLMARKKLTELRNAMVVLTRLEELNDFSEDSQYPVSENEFTVAQEYEFSRNADPALDPLDINGDDGSNLSRRADYKTIPLYGDPTRPGPKKASRKNASALRIVEGATAESGQPDVDVRTGATDPRLQDTTESDVEMTLIWEAEPDEMQSDAEAAIVQDHSICSSMVHIDGVITTDAQNEINVHSMKLPTIISVRSLSQDIATDENSDSGDFGWGIVRNDENLGDTWKRSLGGWEKCKSDERPDDRKDSSAKRRCYKCRATFNDAQSLAQHNKSSLICGGSFHCTTCRSSFPSFAKLRKHLVSCANKGGHEETTVGESTNEEETAIFQNVSPVVDENSATNLKKTKKRTSKNLPPVVHQQSSTNLGKNNKQNSKNLPSAVGKPSSTNSKKNKTQHSQNLLPANDDQSSTNSGQSKMQNSQNHLPAIDDQSSTNSEKNKKPSSKKPKRSKNRSRVDHLICGVCSINFATTQALADHIFTHSPVELQRAFESAQAKEDAAAASSVPERRNSDIVVDDAVTKNAVVPTNNHNSLPLQPVSETSVQTPICVPIDDSLTAQPATVCPCHRDNDPARPDKTDLQIEMVLFCRFCRVVFRRRECFEIHYRTNRQCAADRARARLPKLYCANCQVSLNSWAGMRRHLEIHASLNVEGTVRFVCNICRVVFVGFGTLFYNHWSSHLRDNMLVATSYSFPKSAVQPINGVPKLPIGAAPNESYILVAEHVCSSCHKPFSTRRDLELHESGNCCSPAEKTAGPVDKREYKWFCDVCTLTFPTREGLDAHCKQQHGDRFVCVATIPKFQSFMCTRCSVMRKLVSDMEYHWKHSSDHGAPNTQDIENPSPDVATTQPTSANFGDDPKTKEATMVIDISEDVRSETERVAVAVDKTPEEGPVSANNQESPTSSSTASAGTAPNPNATMLACLLSLQLSKETDSGPRTRIGALEDPCVNIVLSDVSKENVSAKLVIERPRKDAATSTDLGRNMESYKIIMPEKPSLGSIKLALGRTGSESLAERRPTATASATEAGKQGPTANATVASPTRADQLPTLANSPRQNTVICSPQSTKPVIAGEKTSSALSRSLLSKQVNVSVAPAQKSQPSFPEIIDLAEEKEESDGRPTASLGNACERTQIVKNNNVKTADCAKSGVRRSVKVATAINSSSKSNSSAGSATSKRSNGPEMSFEENRLAYMTRLKALPTEDSAGAKKPGFLRVKNLSELQAVKTHTCHACNAAFESHKSLEEHHQVHLCTLVDENPQFLKGMTAALVLPDNPGGSSGKELPQVYTAGSVVTQQLIGLDSGIGVISGVSLPNMIVNNEAAGSWVAVGNQHDSLSSVALMNATHTISGGTLLMNLGGQQSINQNAGALVATSLTSSSPITHAQGLFAMQQQQFQPQPLQQQQGQPMLGSNQHPGNNCGGQFGYHVLPPEVGPRQSLMDKQQRNEGPPRNTTTNNLPINGQSNTVHALPAYRHERPDKYFCNICTTFSSNSANAMNSHVMKHYTGFNKGTANRKSTNSAPGTISTVPVSGTTDMPPRYPELQCKDMPPNPANNVFSNTMFMRHTPQGVVWVTSLTMSNQQPGSSADGGCNRSLVPSNASRPANQTDSNPPPTSGVQIIYRCLICKSAMYKAFQPLRNHVILVHGITDFISMGLDKILQKMYQCRYCIPEPVVYDSEENLREHIASCHTNTCPLCARSFVSLISLKTHAVYCSMTNSGNQNASHPNPR